jgi:hypothetical protein
VTGIKELELGRREMWVKPSDSGVGARLDELGRARDTVSWKGRRKEEMLNVDDAALGGSTLGML